MLNIGDKENMITREEIDFDKIYSFAAEEANFPLHSIREPNHANDIYRDLINGNAKYIAPVTINARTMAIIDGGNRYTAYKRAWDEGHDLKMRAMFIDIPIEDEGSEVVKINTTQKSWGIKDFKKKLDSECNESILRFNEFALGHDFCHGKVNKKTGIAPINMRYTMAFLLGKNESKCIKNGTISISKDDVAFANEIYPEVEAIYNALGYTATANWFENMIQGWYAFRSKTKYAKRYDRFGFDKYIEKLKEGFDTEQLTSSTIWEDRFSSVLCKLEEDSKRLG